MQNRFFRLMASTIPMQNIGFFCKRKGINSMNETMAWLKNGRTLMGEFESGMTNDECPICFVLNKALVRDVDILPETITHDLALRKKINVNGGFCKKHGALMAGSGSSGTLPYISKRWKADPKHADQQGRVTEDG